MDLIIYIKYTCLSFISICLSLFLSLLYGHTRTRTYEHALARTHIYTRAHTFNSIFFLFPSSFLSYLLLSLSHHQRTTHARFTLLPSVLSITTSFRLLTEVISNYPFVFYCTFSSSFIFHLAYALAKDKLRSNRRPLAADMS